MHDKRCQKGLSIMAIQAVRCAPVSRKYNYNGYTYDIGKPAFQHGKLYILNIMMQILIIMAKQVFQANITKIMMKTAEDWKNENIQQSLWMK